MTLSRLAYVEPDRGVPYIEGTLTAGEAKRVVEVARRRVSMLPRNARNQSGERSSNDKGHRLGAGGELFAGLVADIKWHAGVNEFKRVPDLGEYDVRTRSGHRSYIIVRDNDPDNRPVIAVTVGDDGTLRCYGTALYGELKKQQWYGDRSRAGGRLCYWVPHWAFKIPREWRERHG